MGTKWMNEEAVEHLSRYGTHFRADRGDLRNGVEVTKPSCISDKAFASDVAEFSAWHALCVFPNLNGFQGYSCIQFNIK